MTKIICCFINIVTVVKKSSVVFCDDQTQQINFWTGHLFLLSVYNEQHV
jgi:hypothetical protein